MSQSELAAIYKKDQSTIYRWIDAYLKGEGVERKVAQREAGFTTLQINWITDFFHRHPTAYLKEAQSNFICKFNKYISISGIWSLMHKAGYTRKVIERRAMQIKMEEITRFANELNSLNWTKNQLVFMDEVSFDNRDMLRKRGYSLKGERLIMRGEFNRRKRVSYLAFISEEGKFYS
ncbi:Serine kinase [Boothiomyces sp. JEL0838]|nr:Serine kinase [Boothiomyces sp. JEL0838]